jgi:uncharacterized membrane-anchored protein
MNIRLLSLAALVSFSTFAVAQAPAPEAAPDAPAAEVSPEDEAATAAEAEAEAAAFLASLKPQSGAIALPGNLAALQLPENFHYLSPGDTQRLIEEGWGNPPGSGEGTLGMILPRALNPLGDAGWGVIITYTEDGHIADDDAASIDYGEILQGMQEATAANNEERAKAGYETVNLVGWAEPPRYDAASKKIYWAKDLVFGDNPNHTLNYYIRVLGRQGVLELNAVAGMSQLEQVRQGMRQVVGFADFTEGNRYADFNPATDKAAAYGLAALVAGGVAAKTGLFAKLLALVVAFKKFIIIGVIALGGLLARLFKRKAAAGAPPAASGAPPAA